MGTNRKEYELLFKLQANLGGNFNSSFTSAMNVTKKLENSLSSISKIQNNVSGYKKQEEAIRTNKGKLDQLNRTHSETQKRIEETRAKLERLKAAFKDNKQKIKVTTDTAELEKLEKHQETLKTSMHKTTKEIKKMESALAKETHAIDQASGKIVGQKEKLDELGEELKTAGVDTRKLTESNDRLTESYDKIKNSQESFAKISAAQQKTAAAIGTTKAQLAKTTKTIAAGGAAIYAGAIRPAIEFESKMADVVKVVDELKDPKTGKLTAEYKILNRELLDMSTIIPMLPGELAEITAAAGQAGIARKELATFTKDAAKMGIAFDTTAEQAGSWMATWRVAFKMSQTEVVGLADQINYLANTTNSTAPQISEIVSKVGPLGEMAGLTSAQIAAMGATLAATGVQEDVAATAIKKVMTTMISGSSATERQQKVLDKLGISATDLAKRMQVDAQGALIDFMETIKQLPEAEQGAALKDYFGEEAIAPISKLTMNLDFLKEQFNKVGDASQYAGSMEAEYAARADTTENKIKCARGSLTKLSVILGETFLPYIGRAAQKVSELAVKFSEFAEKNPELVKNITRVVASLAGFRLGALVAKLAFLDMRNMVLDGIVIFKKMQGVGGIVKNAIKGMGTAFKLFSSPIGLVIAGIAAVIVIILACIKNWDKIKLVAATVWEKIKEIWGAAGAWFSELWGKIKAPFIAAGEWFNTNVIQPIIRIFSPIIKKVGEIFAKIWEIITVLFSVAATWFHETVVQPIVSKLAAMAGAVGWFFAAMWQKIKDVFASATTWFSEKFTAVWEAIKAVFATVGEFFTGLWNTIKSKFTAIGTAIGDAVGGAFKAVVNAILKFASNKINGFINGINICIGVINKIPGVSVARLSPLEIPKLAKGSNSTPDTFIAGERGAELITNAKGRKVFTAAQTGEIFNNVNRAAQGGVTTVVAIAPLLQSILSAANAIAQNVAMPEVKRAYVGAAAHRLEPVSLDKTRQMTSKIVIHSNPIFQVGENANTMDIQRALDRRDEELLRKIDERRKKEEDDERRGRYD